ncbi:P-loop containing nucleoside triphosphate hydrolase protein [Xylariaceae sp. FL0255]|nr:P-loop containing nucleoside triphosphate hydrolase protein [Xylariaceae sp. FL0255]
MSLFHINFRGGRYSLHDLGFIKDVLEGWATTLDITHLGSLAACASIAPVAWRLVTRAWAEAYSCIVRFFIVSIQVPERDPLNRNVMNWVIANVVRHRKIRSITARTQVLGGDRDDRAALLKKKRRDVQYHPHFSTTWFIYEGSLSFISRSLDSFHSAMGDPSYDGVGGEEITIGCLGRSTRPIKKLIQVCQDYADKQAEFFVIIFSRDRYGMSWQPKARKSIRRLQTVHLDDNVKLALLADIRKYLHPNTKRLYQNRSIPYRRGGKSSLSTALAGEFGLDLYEVKIPCVATDQDLKQMFLEIPPQSIVLLEDVDAIWTDRDSERDDSSVVSRCTLSGLLNVLDEVGSQEGRINNALVRPGRVDMRVALGNISRKSAGQMFIRMFPPYTDESTLRNESKDDQMAELHALALEFSAHIPEDTFSPSQLQGFFQLYLDNAVEAVANIAGWVEKELSGSMSDDDMSVISEEKTFSS